MKHSLLLPLVLGLGGGLLAQDAAQPDERNDNATAMRHHFRPLSDALGTKVLTAGGRDDALRDVAIDARNGECVAILLESGLIFPAGALSWNHSEECFQLHDSATKASASMKRGDASGAAEASADRPAESGRRSAQERRDRKPRDGANTAGMNTASMNTASMDAGRCILASALADLPITGRSQGSDEREEIGTVGDCYVDCASQRVVFLTTKAGGVLGIGAESKVVPYDAFEIARNDAGELCGQTGWTERRLERAPTRNEERNSVTNPQWRESLYSYFGVDRPDWEGRASDRGAAPVRLQKLLDAVVETADGREAAVEELLIDPETSKLAFVALTNGTVQPIERCSWDAKAGRFRIEASGKSGTRGSDDGAKAAEELIDASALLSARTMARDGELGAVSEIYFAPERKEFAWLTILIDTTLGFGGDMKVVSWNAIEVRQQDGNQVVHLDMSKEELRSAPDVDGEVGSSIYDPRFRERIEGAAGESDAAHGGSNGKQG